MLKRSLVGLALVVTVAAQAQVVDFENLPNSDPFFTHQGDIVTSGGYKFAAELNVGAADAIATWGPQMSLYTGSVAIFANYFNDTLLMTQTSGGAFNVTSLDLADVFLNSGPWSLTLTGTRADNSTVSEVVNITSGNTLSTYTLSNMTNIVSMRFDDGLDTSLQIDNINANAVPEPATMAALGLGVAAMIRRRRAR